MTAQSRWGIAIAALAALIVWADASAHAFGRRPILGGLFRDRCPPIVVGPCLPEPIPAAAAPAEPVKEKPLPEVSPDLRVNIKNIAALLKEGNAGGAKKLAAATARQIDGITDLEVLYKNRNKDGLGWGTKAQANPATDGLQKGVTNYAKSVSKSDLTRTAANEEAAYWIAAMAEVTLAGAPKSPDKKAKPWIASAEQVREASLELAKASSANDAVAMKTAAGKVNAGCVNCHTLFK